MNLNKKIILCLAIAFGLSASIFAQKKPIQLLSPDGKIKVDVSLSDKIYYSISGTNEELLTKNHLALTLRNAVLGENPRLKTAKSGSATETLTPYIPLKFSSITSSYNWLLLNFQGDFSVEFRAFNDGVAYRFVTRLKGDVEILEEDCSLGFPADYTLHLQQANGFRTAYEEAYSHISSVTWKPADKMATLPALVDTKRNYKILISESDVSDYPCLFLQGTGDNGIHGVFPKNPLEFGPDGDRSFRILKEADYIAKTTGTRNFPWRYFVIAKDDGQLIQNTMTLRLSPKSTIGDPSWIKPGQASWEWWNDASPYGPDVNFVAGYNLETYKYYIDFASKYGIKYIVMDEGWAKSTLDPYTPNPKVDVHELIRYGKEKNVGIILWLTWLAVHNHMDLFKTFSEWGVQGVKIDFMNRSDQWMVNYYENVAKEAAKHHLFVDFHGAFKPAGLEYKYPNLISYEGVRGMEQMGGCTPDNSIYFPFMRNAVGPMDYTPGAMLSMQPDAYSARRPNAASIGTRAYQMALFVVFESGIQMLADNPTLYYRNPDCTEFISKVPTTWDETKALKAQVGELAVVAKRKGDTWFIGGITNGKEKERTMELNFDFLPKGKVYTMTCFEDGINAGHQAMDYRRKTVQVQQGDKIDIKMVRNGGWAAVLNIAPSNEDKAKSPQVLPGKGLNQFDFFYAGEAKSRNMYIIKNGKIDWSYIGTAGRGEISDAVLMANGNVIFAHQFGVTLIDQNKKVLWHYDAPDGFETHTAQLIGSDHVVFIQNGNPAKVFVANIKTNKIEKEFAIPFRSTTHGQIRHARLTPAGTLLIAHMDLGKVCEYDLDGKELWSLDVPGVWSAVPLKNGNILVTSNNRFVKEITHSGATVWEYLLSEISDYEVTSPQLAVRLPNGNTLINNWFNQWSNKILDVNNAPVQAIEVTPAKKIVWALRSWSNPVNLGPSTTIQLLNDPNNMTENVHFGSIR